MADKCVNSSCCPGCTCPCCSCTCPYCTLGALIDILIAKGVCPDVAAGIAADFVTKQCCQKDC